MRRRLLQVTVQLKHDIPIMPPQIFPVVSRMRCPLDGIEQCIRIYNVCALLLVDLDCGRSGVSHANPECSCWPDPAGLSVPPAVKREPNPRRRPPK